MPGAKDLLGIHRCIRLKCSTFQLIVRKLPISVSSATKFKYNFRPLSHQTKKFDVQKFVHKSIFCVVYELHVSTK